jgi:Protein of unknown function (DUF4239)
MPPRAWAWSNDATMNSILIAVVVFVFVFGGAVAGSLLHRVLPVNHRDGDSRDVIKLVMGLIATIAALVLSLLIASAHSAYDTQESEVRQLAVHYVLLDRMLAHYGPEAADARSMLREVVVADVVRIWPEQGKGIGSASLPKPELRVRGEDVFTMIVKLAPKTEEQRFGQNRSLQLLTDMANTRRLMAEQAGGSLSWPFFVVLVFWLVVLFLGFGLFAKLNPTVLVAYFVGAISVAGAIFLILEMNRPYSGLMQISSAPMHNALEQAGK